MQDANSKRLIRATEFPTALQLTQDKSMYLTENDEFSDKRQLHRKYIMQTNANTDFDLGDVVVVERRPSEVNKLFKTRQLTDVLAVKTQTGYLQIHSGTTNK
jgi:hypothetical protein